MQSLKCWLAVGVAVCAISVRGDDTDAQAKAREALEKKLNEIQGQPAQPAPAKPATKPPQAKPTSTKQTSPPPAATVPSSTFNTPPEADAAAIEKARAAMHEKMNTLQPTATEVPPPAPAPKITVQPPAEPTPAAAPPPPPVAAPPPVTPPPVVAAPAAAAAASVVSSPTPAPPTMPDLPPPSDPEAIAKAREALRQKMNELQAGQPTPPPQAPPAPPAPPPPAVPPAPAASAAAIQPPSTPDLTAPSEADPAAIAKAREAMRLKLQTMGPEPVGASDMVSMRYGKVPQTGMNFPPLQAPPLGISAAKELRLQELLQQYRVDLISPEQYQASRAKILAEP